MMDAGGGDELRRTVRAVRARWRMRVALRGAAIVLGAGLVVLTVAAYGLDHFRYSPWAIAAFRTFAYAALAGLALRFLALPLSVRVADERVALYIEEHDPNLDAALLSAVAAPRAAREGAASPELARRLVEWAVERCQRIEYGRLVERQRLHRFSVSLFAVAGAGMLLAILSPAFLRQAAPFLLAPWSVRAASPYAIEVDPGNATLARGADQLVAARLKGFDSERVEIASHTAEGEWKRAEMTADGGGGGHRFMLLDVKARTEYFVEASGVRSPVFRLEVADVPHVKRIDLEYRYPAYTGLPPQRVEDGGDIAALRGTEVRLRITSTLRVKDGFLAVEGAAPTPLSLADDGALTGALTVARDGFYKIQLRAADGSLKAASPDYAIEAQNDRPPSVAFVKPGRDTQVTPIEEVFAEVKAEDDYGVGRVELRYSVNGGDEKTKVLHEGPPRKFVSAGHTFFLEDLEAKPGDFVSYYARASDVGAPAQTGSTDIYFLEVRPFRRDYHQAEQRGGQGAGQGQNEGALSQQQRQVIAATFKLLRDRARMPGKEWAEDLATLALIEGRLRQQVDQLVSRMMTRGILEPGSEMHETASALRAAIDEMRASEEGLKRKQPKDALPPEQRALAHLQKAEGAFRDVQVTFGSGGGGGGASAQELADLFELELDKLRNQYETVQRGEQQRADDQVDEALQRLQELARRQEQENERRRQMAGRLPSQMAGGGGSSQRDLAEQAEELGRKLERLAREKPSASLEETARRLRDAADAMRRSAAASKSGTAAEGTSALDRLKDARRLLENSRSARLDRDLREAQRRADELKAAQDRVQAEVQELAASGSGAPGERIDRLSERKDAMASEVADLEAQLDQMARESRRDQKEASRRLQESANAIRDHKLKEKIRYSKGLLRTRAPETGPSFESQIGSDLEALARGIREAADAVGSSGEQKLAQALEKARNLARNMESLQGRLRDRGESGSSASGDSRPGQARPGQATGPAGPQQAAGDARDGGQPQQGRGASADAGRSPGQEGGGAPRFSGDDVRQLRRELQERVGEAQELGRELGRAGRPPGEIDPILRKMRALDVDTNRADPLGLAQLTAAVVDDLKMLEYALRKQAGGEREKLHLTGSEELPPGWRSLVEEYYRSLARKPQ